MVADRHAQSDDFSSQAIQLTSALCRPSGRIRTGLCVLQQDGPITLHKTRVVLDRRKKSTLASRRPTAPKGRYMDLWNEFQDISHAFTEMSVLCSYRGTIGQLKSFTKMLIGALDKVNIIVSHGWSITDSTSKYYFTTYIANVLTVPRV